MAPVCSSVPVNLDSVTVNESRTLKLTPLNPAIVILDVFGPVLLVTRQVTSILCVAWCVFLLRSRKKKKKKLYIGSFNYQNQAEIHVVFSHVHTLCIIWCFPREFKRQATGWNAPLPWLKTLIPLSTKHFQQLQRDARHEAAKMWSHHCFAENTTRLWACGGMELSVSSGINWHHFPPSLPLLPLLLLLLLLPAANWRQAGVWWEFQWLVAASALTLRCFCSVERLTNTYAAGTHVHTHTHTHTHICITAAYLLETVFSP